MSRTRRNFSAKFKSDLVIELLKGEKDLTTLAVENNIQPISSATGRRNSLTRLLWFLMIPGKTMSGKNLLPNGKRRRLMPKKLVSSPCRWTGSKKI